MHRVHTLGWDAFQRGRWESINSVFRTGGFLFTTGRLSLDRAFGPQKAYYIAHIGYALMTTWLAFATKPWQFFVTLPLYAFKLLRETTQSTAFQHAGKEAGFGNGEMLAKLSSASKIVGMIIPPIWSRIYAFGMEHNTPGGFYLVITAFTLSKLVLVKMCDVKF